MLLLFVRFTKYIIKQYQQCFVCTQAVRQMLKCLSLSEHYFSLGGEDARVIVWYWVWLKLGSTEETEAILL